MRPCILPHSFIWSQTSADGTHDRERGGSIEGPLSEITWPRTLRSCSCHLFTVAHGYRLDMILASSVS